jgi:adenosylhomocysteine nucleosidase
VSAATRGRTGKAGAQIVVVCAIGLERAALGPRAAAAAAERILRRRPALLVSTGFCGALASNLRPGDLVVATDVLDTASGDRLPVAATAVAGVPGRRGTIATTPHPLTDAASRLGVAGVAVDMESAALARAAAAEGVPFAAVRAVSDAVGDEVPPALAALGDSSPVRAAALLRPRDLPALLGLAGGALRAARALRRALPLVRVPA